jgi:hypothetical protein
MLGQLLGGLFGGGGGGGSVKAERVEIDPETKRLIDEQAREGATKSAQDFAAESMKGVQQAPKDYSRQVEQTEKSLGGAEPGIGKAIQSRYQNVAREGFNKLKNQALLQGHEQKSAKLQNAAAMNQAINNVNAENRKRQQEADAANSRARSSALGSILGIAGTIAGAAIGGPAGAQVGGAVGGMVGSSIK